MTAPLPSNFPFRRIAMALEGRGKGLAHTAVPKLYRGARVLVLPGTRIGPPLPQVNKSQATGEGAMTPQSRESGVIQPFLRGKGRLCYFINKHPFFIAPEPRGDSGQNNI